METNYRIECEECYETTLVLCDGDGTPEFCPCCGRRAEVEKIDQDEL